MVKIAFFDLEKWMEKYIKENLKGHEIYFSNKKLSNTAIDKIKDCEVLATFIHSKPSCKILSQLTKLKMITTMSTGYDHIDIPYCVEKKITVCNVPTYGENTVAEFTFALILDLSRKISESVDKIKMGHFDLDGLRGFDLKDKTIGIVGLGNIGKKVAKMASGFDMNIIAFDPYKDEEFAKKYDIKYKSIDHIFKNCDIITFHVPYNKYTHHLLNMSRVKTMKKGAYIINTSRGKVLDTNALIYGLNKKIIAGAALDVLEDETFIPNDEVQLSSKYFDKNKEELKLLLQEHILTEQDNVIITPHNAFNTKEALIRILDTTIKNIKGYVNKRCINKVNCKL
ncbi:hydroxyacid dehydrogenase [Candidatus Woesearchaeota archaeon]|nr:hydroxyacid dehydrogenase [Candidatus Woesearchaeota archaeon]